MKYYHQLVHILAIISILLFISVGPQFIAYPDNKVVNMSQAVIFYCEATGDPQPSVSWKINVSRIIIAIIMVTCIF